jgi:glutamate transport system permease protein
MRQVLLPQAFRGAVAPLGSVLIALIKNTTVAAVIGVSEAANLMSVIIDREGSDISIFLVFALGFVILTLPLGVFLTSLSRRLAVKR